MAVNFDMRQAWTDYLDNKGWHYQLDDNVLKCGVNIDCKLKSVRITIFFSEYGFTTYAQCPLKAGQDERMEVMEYLTMANYGLRNGNFEMDLTDGEIRYKVYTNCDGMTELPDEILVDCLAVPCHMFDRYGDGLAALLMGFSDAQTEIEKAEQE